MQRGGQLSYSYAETLWLPDMFAEKVGFSIKIVSFIKILLPWKQFPQNNKIQFPPHLKFLSFVSSVEKQNAQMHIH